MAGAVRGGAGFGMVRDGEDWQVGFERGWFRCLKD